MPDYNKGTLMGMLTSNDGDLIHLQRLRKGLKKSILNGLKGIYSLLQGCAWSIQMR